MYRTLAKVTFPSGKGAKKNFSYLKQIREGFGVPSIELAKGLVLFTRPDSKTHQAEVKVASSLRDYELAPTRELLTAVEKAGATVEYL